MKRLAAAFFVAERLFLIGDYPVAAGTEARKDPT
jgi:hypothetical protein